MDVEPSVIGKVNRVFEVLNGIKTERKRMVNMRLIIKQLFPMMNLEVEIDTTKSKRTLKRYEQFWKKLCGRKVM